MLLVITENTEPALNLATEEYLLKNFKEEIFFLWRNAPSIIIGKNQNAYSEIDIDYVKEKNITVVRRQTGGGAVFHDLGNVNFSYITSYKDGEDISFERFTRPVCGFINTLGARAEFAGRNDIVIDGQKISGNAQTVYKNRFLHHGTLLFSADMTDLSKALTVNPLKIQSKGIKSVRARVTNISAHIKEQMDVKEFMARLFSYTAQSDPDGRIYELTDKDMEAIRKLRAEKYGAWSWNFGENPDYSFKKGAKFTAGIIEVGMNIENEQIKDISLKGDFFANGEIDGLESLLRGLPHREEDIRKALSDIDLKPYIGAITEDELVSVLF